MYDDATDYAYQVIINDQLLHALCITCSKVAKSQWAGDAIELLGIIEKYYKRTLEGHMRFAGVQTYGIKWNVLANELHTYFTNEGLI